MQNVSQGSATDNPKIDKVNGGHEIENLPSTPHSTSNSSPAKSETETYSEHRRYMSETSESEEDSVSEVDVESFVIDQEFEEDPQVEATKFLLTPEEDRSVDPETQARLEALLQAAGISQLAPKDGKHLADPEVLRRLTSSVSCALDEAAAALSRMRTDNNSRSQSERISLVEACTDGDVGTVRKLLTEGRSVHETSEEGESLLSLACSAGYFELAQVLLAMHANVEDRGIKGECTPLMEAASAGHLDIVRLLVAHGADVNAQSTSGNTPLMYGCAGGHQDVVEFLLKNDANVEDHNENGHTPLMEAASAGHVGLAKLLLEHGAGINTHSDEFKESALTLACYKGHLDMVGFLLAAGADQEHKTDEMHTALMEASMDGHVEVARLLLDSGAQVNMPTDSFESPLTLAACGGHVDLAMLLLERGANIEEVNDEGYTPLMEAAREGHEEMVALLLSQGKKSANINAQTDETQETALTLACCGGFTEVADFLIKAGADIELGASTPLMEAAQEGHLELVKYLLEHNANVHAETQTGDTALTYACENGHTDVADLLLQYDADLEHESEGGRTPLMKACRAGHLCTVQFLISKGADVGRQTTNNDHTPLSLACAGGHLPVVELLLAHHADPNHKLKDNSTMLIEAAKGGHTNVVQLLLDYPHSMMLNQQGASTGAAAATNLAMLPGHVGNGSNRDSPMPAGNVAPVVNQQINYFQPPPCISSTDFSAAVLQEVPEAVRIVSQDDGQDVNKQVSNAGTNRLQDTMGIKGNGRKSLLQKNWSAPPGSVFEGNLTSSEAQQVRTQPLPLADFDDPDMFSASATMEFLANEDPSFLEKNGTLIDFIKNRKKQINIVGSSSGADEGSAQKQQILEELHYSTPQESCPTTTANTTATLPHMLNIDIATQQQQQSQQQTQQQQQTLATTALTGSIFPAPNLQVHNTFYAGASTCLQTNTNIPLKLAVNNTEATSGFQPNQQQQQPTQPSAFYFTPLANQPIKFQTVTAAHTEVSQNTAISDRPKAKPVSKKEGKNLRKQQLQQQLQQHHHQQLQFQQNLFSQQPQIFGQLTQQTQEALNCQSLDLDAMDHEEFMLQDKTQDGMVTATSLFRQFAHTGPPVSTAFIPSSPQQKARMELYDQALEAANKSFIEQKTKELSLTDKDAFTPDLVDEVVQSLDSYTVADVTEQAYSTTAALDESMMATLTATQDGDVSRVEYFAVPANNGQLPVQVQHTLYPYEHYLQTVGTVANMSNKEQSGAIYQAGFQAGINLMQQQLACPNASVTETLTSTSSTVTALPPVTSSQQQQQQQQQPAFQPSAAAPPPPCSHVQQQQQHHCQVAGNAANVTCAQHQQQQQQQPQQTMQVQAATQTQPDGKKPSKSSGTQDGVKIKKRLLFSRHQQQQQAGGGGFTQQPGNGYQIDSNTAITQYGGTTQQQQCVNGVQQSNYCMDVDSETESNHDTALTLACAGGHEELVELLLNRGADIEHRDKKGFTPLILAATAGHEKVVEILLNHNADIEAQSERTKDTPLSLACSGGRYEVVELLLNRNANKEHRNVSDYTPLSLAASGGYVNIIKLLLNHGAEINSRTGSKLGISPLMLAAMNGHTAAVKLLLDMGSDINAQIETNRNTALTLACFQGRHEVVSLLLDRKANVEHRAKTGLTPLMEAASGGYVEVGRVLLDKGADVNATPVPSSRDTALTIAADKGHVRFVELLLYRGAAVEVKNKKGNSPLWLAANGGHLSVVELLYNRSANIDSQDNRKVSCLMAAFRKGHTKVVKWMVNHVTQFPSDQEMIRYIATVSDKDLLEKCQECVKIIRAAKETQAAKANKNATILLEELDMEKNREESKKAAAARRRERKKKKKLEKKEEKRKLTEENQKNDKYDDNDDKKSSDDEETNKADDEDAIGETSPTIDSAIRNGDSHLQDKEEGDSGIDANSQGSCSSQDVKSKEKRKEKKKKKSTATSASGANNKNGGASSYETQSNNSATSSGKYSDMKDVATATERRKDGEKQDGKKSKESSHHIRKGMVFEASRHPAEREDFEATGNETYVPTSKSKKTHSDNEASLQSSPPSASKSSSSTSPKQGGKREDGWKEVVRKSSMQTVSMTESGSKKVSVPLNAISRVIGRAGSNINAIRATTGAHIEVEKQSKGQGERIITIKGSADATKQAHNLIAALIKDPDVDILQMLPKSNKTSSSSTTLWDKTQIGTKKATGKAPPTSQPAVTTATVAKTVSTTTSSTSIRTTTSAVKPRNFVATNTTRVTAPRLAAQAEKLTSGITSVARTSISSAPSSFSGSNAITTSARASATKVIAGSSAPQTFAAKLTETSSTGQLQVSVGAKCRPASGQQQQQLGLPQQTVAPTSPQTMHNVQSSPKHARPSSIASQGVQHFLAPGTKHPFPMQTPTTTSDPAAATANHVNQTRSPTPVVSHSSSSSAPSSGPGSAAGNHEDISVSQGVHATSEYSLFNSMAQQPMWRRENESQKQVNFAAVTGGGAASSQASAQPKFIDQEPPPQVDASKAPGYRGTAVCSPVSSKTSSSSATPPNMPAAGFQCFPEPLKTQQTLPPIGSSIMRPTSQSNASDHYYSSGADLQRHMQDVGGFKGAGGFADGSVLGDHQHLLSSYHQVQQHLNYSQPQQSNQGAVPAVSMSRLNPKAPDFSSSMHGLGAKQSPQMFNGYMGNQTNNGGIFPIGKTSMGNYRSSVATQQQQQPRNWQLMQMQQPFTQQQSEIISGMATGMTIHGLARATGGEILENGGELVGVVNSSPSMSPNMQGGGSGAGGGVVPPPLHPADGRFLEDRKQQPQPIGTERARKIYPQSDSSWILGSEVKGMGGGIRWPGSSPIDRYSNMPRGGGQIFMEDLPHMMDTYQHGVPVETVPNVNTNGPLLQQFYFQRQMESDFNIPSKMDLPWEAARPNMSDMQDKPHGWTGLTNKWN